MSNTWYRIVVCVFFGMVSSTSAADRQSGGQKQAARVSSLGLYCGAAHWTTNLASAKDAHYILDYVADSYSCGKDRDQQQFKLGTTALLVMKDVPEDKEVLNKWHVVNMAFEMDEKPVLDDFYQEIARTVAQEVFDCLLKNGRLRR